ncbi:acyl dehydratase [Frankia sp. CNm7]|uniref:Acyl dehydratase n=1 Tax=Frankia nepalensis TaxID=1836974 RepID=A0A937UNH4_9ACTN|nr:MaoC family dehydratase [Frankia nepalensis]MBL7502123.1 acyl dehydratase [Frankia nepalensis]MBL7512904.1 acyl dehydratase [Frankia nepalensis]MBL7524909.1 acyl dehydratase [Frankia nepalensis]MBL7628093.1 acyl dehydratase [Frankia nepalensis]
MASEAALGAVVAEGPYFDELAVGQVFRSAPGVTLTSGLADAHRAIVGGRLALALDAALCADVTHTASAIPPFAPPNVVWDVAIGQSTVVTHHVKANLFYRGLVFRRTPRIGDTLRTTTEVVALRQNKSRPGRRPTGLAVLRITTVDQHGRGVLDFWRCAMLPLRDADLATGHADDTGIVGTQPTPAELAAVVDGWDLKPFAELVAGPRFTDLAVGQTWRVGGGDVVSSAPELARLTLNVAQVHHDGAAAGGRRLVYGGHTIGIAFAQVTRALPSLVTVAGWEGCDHTGPVHEGDTLRGEVTVEGLTPLVTGGGLARLRCLVRADAEAPNVGAPNVETPDTETPGIEALGAPARDVLDWRFFAVFP